MRIHNKRILVTCIFLEYSKIVVQCTLAIYMIFLGFEQLTDIPWEPDALNRSATDKVKVSYKNVDAT